MSKLYREKIDQLQAAEQRLLEQKAEAQRAARTLTEQARRDGDGLVREAQNAVKVLENEAMQRAGEAGQELPGFEMRPYILRAVKVVGDDDAALQSARLHILPQRGQLFRNGHGAHPFSRNSIAHFPQNSTPVCAIVRAAARTFIYRV